MKIIYSPKCLEYSAVLHPETPQRVEKAYEVLKEKGYKFIEPSPASEKEILSVHEPGYVEEIKTSQFFDPDTPAYIGIYDYARLSVGGAILAAKEKIFSLMRPPGHHAGKYGPALGAPTLGFCYFNNIAIAVRKLGLSTLILDIDGHHGNGTQEIFLGDPKVQFISLHRGDHKGRFYPGTGSESESNCLNHMFYKPPHDNLYIKTLDKMLGQVDVKAVEIIGISAGFDGHDKDLASLGLSSNAYRKIGERVGSLEKPVFAVLEGGYVGEKVGADIDELIKGLENA